MYVYFLTDGSRRSYIGYSTDVFKRYRAHTLKLACSAKYTKGFKSCILEAYISGLPSKRAALSLEWFCKRRYKKAKQLTGKIHHRLSTFFHPLSIGKHKHSDIVIHVRRPELVKQLEDIYHLPVKLIAEIEKPTRKRIKK